MQTVHSAQEKSGAIKQLPMSLIVNGVLAVVSIAMALVSIFTMANWAELSTTHHALQHVLLFVGGVGVGTSFRNLLKRGN